MKKNIVLGKRLWKILPGKENIYFDTWKKRKHIGIGLWRYGEVNNKLHEFIKNAKSSDEIKKELEILHPKQRKIKGAYGKPGHVANELWSFYHEIRKGDTVIIYGKNPTHWLLGRVSSKEVVPNPYAKNDADFRQIRKVTWVIPDNAERPENLFKHTYNARAVVSDESGTELRTLESFLKEHGFKIKEAQTVSTKEIKSFKDSEALEGEQQVREASFRKRNAQLIIEKKKGSDYRCKVCTMKFEERYGKIGKEYIIAHHKEPIGARKRASPTSFKDLALVCANCHAMLHYKTKKPREIEELRKLVNKNAQTQPNL